MKISRTTILKLKKWKIKQISKLNINQIKAGLRSQYKIEGRSIKISKGVTEAGLIKYINNMDLINYDCWDKKPKVQAKPKKRKFHFCINVCGFDDCDEDCLPYFMEEMNMKCDHSNQCGDAWFSFMATTQEAKDWRMEHRENIEEYTALYTETKKRKSFYWGDMDHW